MPILWKLVHMLLNVCQVESNDKKGILSEFAFFSKARLGISENAVYSVQIQAKFRWFYATDQCSEFPWSVTLFGQICFVGRMYLLGQGWFSQVLNLLVVVIVCYAILNYIAEPFPSMRPKAKGLLPWKKLKTFQNVFFLHWLCTEWLLLPNSMGNIWLGPWNVAKNIEKSHLYRCRRVCGAELQVGFSLRPLG